MRLLGFPFKLAAALAVSLGLFVVLPVLHSMFGNKVKASSRRLNSRRVVTQLVKKKRKEKRKEKRRIRKVRSARARRMTSAFRMRFAPNLKGVGGEGVAVTAHETKAVIFKEGETDEPPIPVRITPIPFPDVARALGVAGSLVIEIIIGRSGRVESVTVLKSPHSSFSAAARRTAMGWLFKPGKNKGVPVRIRARKMIVFKLEQ